MHGACQKWKTKLIFQLFDSFLLMVVFFLRTINEISIPVMNRGRISPTGNSGISGVDVSWGDAVAVDEGSCVVWGVEVGVGVGDGEGDTCGSSEL